MFDIPGYFRPMNSNISIETNNSYNYLTCEKCYFLPRGKPAHTGCSSVVSNSST